MVACTPHACRQVAPQRMLTLSPPSPFTSPPPLHLHFTHAQVILLEGRNRPGGRVYTARLEAGGIAAAADLGGSIITGIDGNPLAVLAKQMGIPMHSIDSRCPLYLEGGQVGVG